MTIGVPKFENAALVSDDAAFAARVSSLFTRAGRYFPVLDGPRMGRPDAQNEISRRRHAVHLTKAEHLLMGMLSHAPAKSIGEAASKCTVNDEFEAQVQGLRGNVKRPAKAFPWGPQRLGVGLYLARAAKQELVLDLDESPSQHLVERGRHLLVAVEEGDALAEVTASNFAFATGASFVLFPELDEDHREDWTEEVYALGDGVDITGRLLAITSRARAHLGGIDFAKYKSVLFVTGGFPWGMAVPEVPTTHMYRYPDFGRCLIEGIWASQDASRSSRNALLIDPQTVQGSEIPAIAKALHANGTLPRVLKGEVARQLHVQFLLDLVPHDIIVISSHAGDAPGERITYEYPDDEGKQRRLVVDRALGFSYDPYDDKVGVAEFHRFHSLDGVDWRDKAAKAALPVGSAINAWSRTGGPVDRKKYVVGTEPIDRVIGSMAILLHDGVWLYASQGFPSYVAPLVVCNACWSWHELGVRTVLAGARGYIGALYPVLDPEAQEVGKGLFGRHIGEALPEALWHTQNETYGSSVRRPYVMVGLPFVYVRPNVVEPRKYIRKTYGKAIAYWSEIGRTAQDKRFRRMAHRYSVFLTEDLQHFYGSRASEDDPSRR